MSNTVKTENYLNNLIEKSYDAQHGYENAAEVVDNVQLKKWFISQAQRRTEYAGALINEMNNVNGEAHLSGSFTGDMHRSWTNLKAALSSNKEETILEECLRGEKATIEEYENVLEHKGELPPTIVSILQAQKDEVQSTVNTVKRLEDIADDLDR
ncbi:hypothetical protein AAT17_11585 [Nonlabens sp. MIC269]|uniref:ferritin-like domain-containing protein n=1 Tax=Nonlabens TaxID=363408 RepID=UPI0007224CEF|nr:MULTISPECIES: PA2169 family four-helix-bundle protein [Nonlabens]ALM21831.1 hypothetical protein AAT17_11585 [Nonlabens sp. MIC269]PQJ13943.1 hypothetical protein BST93_11810 [Nonlabens tegetincola]